MCLCVPKTNRINTREVLHWLQDCLDRRTNSVVRGGPDAPDIRYVDAVADVVTIVIARMTA
jgi:hypothetical protein